MNRLVTLLLTALLCLGSTASALEVGKPAPDFTLTDTQGKSQKLSAYRGKTVVVEWFNFDCPFVKKHYGSGHMQSLQKDAADRGVIWLAVLSSAPGKQGHYPAARLNEMAAERKAAAKAMLLDESGSVGHLYGAKTTPHLYVVNTKGVLVYQGAIDDKPSTDAEDIPGARNHLKMALDETLAGKPVTVSTTQPYGCSVKYAQ